MISINLPVLPDDEERSPRPGTTLAPPVSANWQKLAGIAGKRGTISLARNRAGQKQDLARTGEFRTGGHETCRDAPGDGSRIARGNGGTAGAVNHQGPA